MNVLKGQKADVTKGRMVTEFQVHMGWSTQQNGMEIDGACFMLSAAGLCERDEDFIFYGQPVSRGNAISHLQQTGEKKDVFRFSIPQLPSDIQKIAFTVKIFRWKPLLWMVNYIFIRVTGSFMRLEAVFMAD